MFLDDKIFEIMCRCDINDDESIKGTCKKVIDACFDHITSLDRNNKTNEMILATFKRSHAAYNIANEKFRKQFGEDKCPLIRDGFKKFVKGCDGKDGRTDLTEFIKLLNW